MRALSCRFASISKSLEPSLRSKKRRGPPSGSEFIKVYKHAKPPLICLLFAQLSGASPVTCPAAQPFSMFNELCPMRLAREYRNCGHFKIMQTIQTG